MLDLDIAALHEWHLVYQIFLSKPHIYGMDMIKELKWKTLLLQEGLTSFISSMFSKKLTSKKLMRVELKGWVVCPICESEVVIDK